MPELVSGRVIYTQTEDGENSALCRTLNGFQFVIKGSSWGQVRSHGLKVPELVKSAGRHTGPLPANNETIYALVKFTSRDIIQIAEAWCTAERYEAGLRCIFKEHKVLLSKDTLDALREVIAVGSASRGSHQYANDMDVINQAIWGDGYEPRLAAWKRHELVMNFTQHYVHGRPAEEVNNPAPS